jgi:hypothetical protein
MSKMCSPSNPAGTSCPSQKVLPGAFVFHERTTMSSQTTTSPWSPLQNVREICFGASGCEMSLMLKPSQFPWIASFPQNAMSVWMSGFPTAGLIRLAGSSMCPSGCMFGVRGSVL